MMSRSLTKPPGERGLLKIQATPARKTCEQVPLSIALKIGTMTKTAGVCYREVRKEGKGPRETGSREPLESFG